MTRSRWQYCENCRIFNVRLVQGQHVVKDKEQFLKVLAHLERARRLGTG
jgi:hypothetical protein